MLAFQHLGTGEQEKSGEQDVQGSHKSVRTLPTIQPTLKFWIGTIVETWTEMPRGSFLWSLLPTFDYS